MCLAVLTANYWSSSAHNNAKKDDNNNSNNLFDENAEDEEEVDEISDNFAMVLNASGSNPSTLNNTGNGRDQSVSDELENFRMQWKCEISQNSVNNSVANVMSVHKQKPEINNNRISHKELEPEPKKMFLIGEYDDDKNEERSDDDSNESDDNDEDDDFFENNENLKIRKNSSNFTCVPEFSQQAMHISALPVEILTYIFKWVVSSYLDVDSLERLALVCKSFYIIARSEDIWKLICMRTWERNIMLSSYPSFRQMFIERPRVRFNGCYISKSTYFRNGEKSFDGLYKPLHVVDYFRYIRFYPEGKVYMLNSPDQPLNVLPHLKTKSSYVQGLQHGLYKLTNDKLSLVLKKKPDPYNRTRRYVRNSKYYTDYEQTFYLEFTLKTVGKKRHSQLLWNKYTLHSCNKSTNELTAVTFELSSNNYPPLYFTTIKSFMAYAECPL